MTIHSFAARPLRRQFLIPLGVVAAVALFSQAILFFHTASLEKDAQLINDAGRQRMLATRLGHQADHVASANGKEQPAAQETLRSVAAAMESEHMELFHSPNPFNGAPSVRRVLDDEGLQTDTERLLAAAFRLADAERPDETNTDLRDIRRLSPSVVQRTNKVVAAYEAVAHRRLTTLIAVEAAALGLMFATLGFIALRVFRPMAARIEEAHADLAKNNAALARHRDELAAANVAVTQFRNRLQAILESAGEGICGLDADHHVTFANPAAERLLGVSAQPLLGRWFPALSVDGRIASGAARLRRDDGGEFDALLTLTALREMGAATGAVLLFTDITAEKRLQGALEAERGFVSTVLDTVASLVMVLDRHGNVVRFNRRCEEVTGYTFSEVRGKPCWEVFVPNDERDCVRAQFSDLQENRFPARSEGQWLTRQGERRLIAWSHSPLRNPQGIPEFVVATGLDITEDRRLRRALGQSELRYSNIVSDAGEAILTLDENGRLLEANPTAEQLFGVAGEALLQRPFTELVREDARERIRTFFAEVTAQGNARAADLPIVARNGETRLTEIAASLVPREDTLIVQAVIHDITERRRHEESIALSARVFESSSDGILITDADMRILQVNHAFEIITGYSRYEAVGKTPRLLSSGRHNEEFYAELWRQLTTVGRWQGELWNRRKNGDIYVELATIDEIRDENGEARNYIAIFRDVTAHKVMEENLRHLASFDPLTGLPNRALFGDRLNQALAQAARNEAKVILMLLDLDHFKQINDTLGHLVGDELLQETAVRLIGCVRESDTVARLGGDEFTIILHNMHDLAHVTQVAEKIIRAINEPFVLRGEARHISTSIGIAVYPDGAHDSATLLRQADIAMYAAKRAGGSGFRFHSRDMEHLPAA